MSKKYDWQNIGFQYRKTDSYVKAEFKNGSWQDIDLCTDENIALHIAATCLHYGQSCFEGMKAFTRKDGAIAIFRPDENAKRLIRTAHRLLMVPPTEELFLEAVNTVIKENIDYVPPYGTGASLYIRPLLIGVTPRIGLQSSEDYTFYVLVMPVGPYYKDGFFPIKACVHEEYDRAAPKGVGNIKAAGNYAAGMKGDMEMKKKGYPISLYLDSSTHTYIDEFSTSNFIAITADKRYVTPQSTSILESITNKSLQVLTKDFGFTVEQRPVLFSEIDQFVEVGACGTAAVITPIYSITRGDTEYTFGSKDKAGETLTRLYEELQGIQYGEIEDRHGWMAAVKK
jgi:branched-chain amino acid aminotransferase